MIFTYSRQRRELSRLLALAEPLSALYGDRWRLVRQGYVFHAADIPAPLPSFRPWAEEFPIREIQVAAYRDRMAFRAAIEATRAYWTEGTRFCLSVWPAPEVPAAERWARVYLWVRANAVSVEIDLEHVPHWDPLDYLPPIIAAGRLPLELRRKNGRIVLSHLESGEELAASPGTATGLRRWSCPLLGETVEGAVERVEGILAAVRRGELAEDWGFLVPETSEADDQARLALWEGLVSHQPNVASYTVSFVLGIGAAEAMESLRSFPGGWTTRYWFGSVNLRDEQGNPVGFEEDDGVALFINVGVETSPAGHRLVLESNNSFNRDPITRVTGLTFTEWEV